MPFITIGNEKNLDQLLEKHFAGLSGAQLKKVRDATLKANPHLREPGGFKPGKVVVFPESSKPDAKPSGRRNGSQSDAVADVSEALKRYAPQLTTDLASARAELEQSAKLLKSAAFKRALEGGSDEVVKMAKALDSSLAEEIEANHALSKRLPPEMDGLLKDLASLAKKLA